jgi:leucyl aminopeptidase
MMVYVLLHATEWLYEQVLGLARMLMAGSAPVRLRVLVAAVENNIAGNAFRPGDVLTARNGK